MKTKNIMWGIAMLATVLILSSFAGTRHDGLRKIFQQNPETRANVISFIMKDRLDLTDKQVAEAYAINLKYAQKAQPLFDEGDSLKEHVGEMIEMNNSRKEELLQILTNDQLETANDIRQQWIERLEKILKKLKANDSINN